MNASTIRSLELFQVPPRWLFLKITTEDGLAGWGEPIVEGKADTVRVCVEEMGEALVGKDASHIEDLWQTLYRGGFYRGGPVLTSAISGIEQALWDLKGKRLGVPIYDLLGGPVREKMRVYAWIGGDDPASVAESAKTQIAAGYTALKMNATGALEWIDFGGKVQEAAERLASAREAVGPNIGIGIDFHGRVHKSMAKLLAKELEPFNPLFFEEPVLAENNDALREIARHTSVPIATGERQYTRWGFKAVLTDGIVDIIQPDLSHAGGIWETRKIAAMAEAFDVAVAPHCPLGPIALAASLQLDFCTPNAFIQEQSLGIHYNQGSDLLDYLADPTVFHYQAGYVPRLTGPGLGIEINEAKVREMAAIGHRWRNPLW
ncbi:MAG: galactonate dehydratase, partial [Armatimonadota bacterium]|nr:galactonate dehydratase [Armatimonadota bacterium]